MGRGGDRQGHGGTRVRCGDRKRSCHLWLEEISCPEWERHSFRKLTSSGTFVISELNTRHLLGGNLWSERARNMETQALASQTVGMKTGSSS